MGWWVTILWVVDNTLDMEGDLDEHKISCVQNFRPLGAVEAYNSYNGVGS